MKQPSAYSSIWVDLGHLNEYFICVVLNTKEENAIVERANQEVIRHLRALLFDKRVYNKLSFEELPQVQRIMNTVKISRVQTRGSHMQDSGMQRNCMSTCEYTRCDR